MGFPPATRCECCDRAEREIAGVACSAMGPISLMYCYDCAEKGAEPKLLILNLIEECGGIDGIRPEIVEAVTYFENGSYHPMKSLSNVLPKGTA